MCTAYLLQWIRRPESFLRSLFWLPILLMSACTTPVKDGTFRIMYQSGMDPVFAIPSVRERMIYLAQQEWSLFGRPIADYNGGEPELIFTVDNEAAHETQAPYFSRVILYWYNATHLPLLNHEGEVRPWSAAFIVWLARSAGVSEQDLPSTVLHWDYIQHSLSAGKNARFIARDAHFFSPKPGDLLCAPRSEVFTQQVQSFKQLRRGPYHCDLVVAKNYDALEVIGGNVLDAVSMTRVELDGKGIVKPTQERPWLIVLEQREGNKDER
ncbi:DUF2272 domain-containing protein [Methylotuvimicrobium buryatense]|nr:DUF2272 domain-containing protein [Methylotuvimicrobium buryatense]